MADRYSLTNEGDSDGKAGSTPTAGGVLGIVQPGSPSRRAAIYDVIFGTSGSAADNQIAYTLQRATAINGTTRAEKPLDPNGFGSSLDSTIDIIATTTVTDGEEMLHFGANQRSTQRWVAAPGSELWLSNTAANGFLFYGIHASATPDIEATILFME